MKMIEIKIDEFVKKLLNGERDFKEISMKDSSIIEDTIISDISYYFVREYELGELKKNPVDISNSRIRNLNARGGLFLPYLIARNCELSFLNVAGYQESQEGVAVLHDCDFSNSQLIGAKFYLANLSSICLEKADINCADFTDAIQLNIRDKGVLNANKARGYNNKSNLISIDFKKKFH